MRKEKELLRRCEQAHSGLAPFRRMRRRCKDFAYGRQWSDTYRLSTGRLVKEVDRMVEAGRIPVTNNLIRQLLKSIVGRYRYLEAVAAAEQEGTESLLLSGKGAVSDTDARALEEFLISGCVCQRLPMPGEGGEVINVSPERLFADSFLQPDASDCRLLGMLHDVSTGEFLSRFGRGDHRRMERLLQLARNRDGAGAILSMDNGEQISFHHTMREGYTRVIEVWERDWRLVTDCREQGSDLTLRDYHSPGNIFRLERENRHRAKLGRPLLDYRSDVMECWRHVWLAPTGEVLESHEYDLSVRPSLLLTLYPMIDGEVHSLVEDVIDQQKYINRLITMMDDVINHSAKGVILFPVDQLPEGFSWRDLRDLWSSPASIIPFRRTSKTVMPTQLETTGTSAGAAEMLKMQMTLFDEISGQTEAVRNAGKSATGADMLRQQIENATVSMLDLLSVFKSFIRRRDEMQPLEYKTLQTE